MTLVYLVAIYCMAGDPPNPYARNAPVKVEAPACMEHREIYDDTLHNCLTRGVSTHGRRLAKLHGPPFVYSGVYCRQIKE